VETLVEAMNRLRALGYDVDLSAAPGGQLRCGACDELVDAARATIDEIVRFEGDSNPDDEAILAAISMPSGHRGLYTSAYGTDVTADDAEVLQALARR
jgi:hypothetical protein